MNSDSISKTLEDRGFKRKEADILINFAEEIDNDN